MKPNRLQGFLLPRLMGLLTLWSLALWSLAGCGAPPVLLAPSTVPEPPVAAPYVPPEQDVTVIELVGPMAVPQAEISGMAWYRDFLILLPQYPDRWQNSLYALSREEILAYLAQPSTAAPLVPRAVPLVAPQLPLIPGYEGLEGIQIWGEQLFVTVEARPGPMQGYLVQGEIAGDLSRIELDTINLRPLSPQTGIGNLTDEAVTVVDGTVITLYEANGAGVNGTPTAHRFGLDLEPWNPIPFPQLEYRVTDATLPDRDGQFWVINLFWPGDQALYTVSDPLRDRYGAGASHQEATAVERLVALQVGPQGISLVDRPPIQLHLLGGPLTRNWEGIALLEDRGFLLVTDQHPATILAFVPWPSVSNP